ncbi:MBL fold metallo-hydrolase [Streptomyces peucetius]|uniref:MBL fold metallo-hydrolase n=1 Tax=Streptomyces peucetius TaxID=1950 RepID=A0ABY6IG09_STRPE|nr:MBL fold metallo-hydrolase [Streptomyces peucetius]UYQ65941.1 MBL fold metallo-hydrolase [Streptomyces peucetius]
MSEHTNMRHDDGRRTFVRRTLLRGAAVGAAAPLLPAAAGAAQAAPDAAPVGADAAPVGSAGSASGAVRPDAATLRWLGTSGWRIGVGVGGRTVLFDPYITRFPTGLFGPKGFDPDTRLRSDEELVARHAGRPELVLVSHTHWDHVGDVPCIATSTGARVIGTETTYHVLRALGVDAGQISVVKGGEVLDFDGFTVEVVASRHSRNAKWSYFAPGTLHAPPRPAPRTVSDLPEGDTLAFQVTVADGPSFFLMGASDFDERSAAGLRPDVLMAATPSSRSTHRYLPRLLSTLGNPGTVVPVHWDNFEEPLSAPPRRDPAMDLDAFTAEVRRLSPASRIVVPDYATVYGADLRPTA